MNILIVANHYPVCSARYAADAFTRLGHNVKHVGRPMGLDIWGMQVPAEYVWKPDTTLEWLELRDLSGFSEDMVIVMDSDPSLLDRLETMRDYRNWRRVPQVIWGVDNHVRDYRRPYFDHYFLAHKSVSVMDWGEEIYDEDSGDDVGWLDNADMTWLPCAYDPVAFPPSPIPWEQREYDVCMIGVMYPKRWELVNALRAAGLKVLAGTGLVYDAYRDAYHNSRVALVSSACGDLPIRTFEALGMGCIALTDKQIDMALLKPPLSGYVEYESAEECVVLARDLSQHMPPDEGQMMADMAVRFAQPHTWGARAQVVIDWLEGRP